MSPDAAATPAALGRKDVLRIADFFEGRISAAYHFAHSVWLPEAARTLDQLAGGLEDPGNSNLPFLCDHLREGARSVGAAAYVEDATVIERSIQMGQIGDASALIERARRRLEETGVWLERRLRPRRPRAARQSHSRGYRPKNEDIRVHLGLGDDVV